MKGYRYIAVILIFLILPFSLATMGRYSNIQEAYKSDCIWLFKGVGDTYTCISKIDELIEPQTLSLAAPRMALLINGQNYVKELFISGEFWSNETPYQLYVGYDYDEDGEFDYIEIEEFYSKYFNVNIIPSEPVRKVIIFGDVRIDWGRVEFENDEKYTSHVEWLGYVEGWIVEDSWAKEKYYLLEIPLKVDNLNKFVKNGLIKVNNTVYYLEYFKRVEEYPLSRERWKMCIEGCIALSPEQGNIVYLYVPVTEIIKEDAIFSDRIWFTIHIKDSINLITPVNFTHFLTLKNENSENEYITVSSPIELFGEITGILLIDKSRNKTFYIINVPIHILKRSFYSKLNSIRVEVNGKEIYLQNLDFHSSFDEKHCLHGCIIRENSLWHIFLNIGEERGMISFSIQKIRLKIKEGDKILVEYEGDVTFGKQIFINDTKREKVTNTIIKEEKPNIDSFTLLSLILKIEKIRLSLISIKSDMEYIASYYKGSPAEKCWINAIDHINNAINIIDSLKNQIKNKKIINKTELKEYLYSIREELEYAINNVLYC